MNYNEFIEMTNTKIECLVAQRALMERTAIELELKNENGDSFYEMARKFEAKINYYGFIKDHFEFTNNELYHLIRLIMDRIETVEKYGELEILLKTLLDKLRPLF